MTFDDLYDAMEDVRRTPVTAGIAAHPVLVQRIKYAAATNVGMTFAEHSAFTLLGTPLVEDHDIAPETVWVFYDQDLWGFYLRHRELQRELRKYDAATPFRFTAYVEQGLIIEADIRSLIDRT